MSAANPEPLSNNPQDQLTRIKLDNPTRRKNLLPQVIKDETNIRQGVSEYSEYRAAVDILSKNPQDKEAKKTVRSFYDPLLSHQYQHGKPNNLTDIRTGPINTAAEINQAYRSTLDQENKNVAIVAQGLGRCQAAIAAGDPRMAILTLTSYPELAYIPELCQSLEALVAQQIATNQPIPETVSINAGQYNEYRQTPILSVIANDSTKELGQLANLSYLTAAHLNDDPFPEASATSLDHLSRLFVEFGQSSDRQNNLNQESDLTTVAGETNSAFKQISDDLNSGYASIEDSVNKGILTEKLQPEILSVKLDGLFMNHERVAGILSRLTTTEIYTQLPPSVQQDIRFQILGHAVSLAQNFAGSGSTTYEGANKNRIEVLGQLLTPLVSADNVTYHIASATDLQPETVEAILIQRVIETVKTSSENAGNALRDALVKRQTELSDQQVATANTAAQAEVDQKEGKKSPQLEFIEQGVSDIISAETTRQLTQIGQLNQGKILPLSTEAFAREDNLDPNDLRSYIAEIVPDITLSPEAASQLDTIVRLALTKRNEYHQKIKGIWPLKKKGYEPTDLTSVENKLKTARENYDSATNENRIQLYNEMHALLMVHKYLEQHQV